MQSPIDVVSTEAAVNIRHMEGFYFHNYDRTFKNTALRNNGHTVVLTIQDSFANMPKVRTRDVKMTSLLTLFFRYPEEAWMAITCLDSCTFTGASRTATDPSTPLTRSKGIN